MLDETPIHPGDASGINSSYSGEQPWRMGDSLIFEVEQMHPTYWPPILQIYAVWLGVLVLGAVVLSLFPPKHKDDHRGDDL